MNIYYIDLDKFDKEKLDVLITNDTYNMQYNNNLRKYQHYAGIYLVNKISKLYGIDNPVICYENEKPYLKNQSLKFNISHSENFIVCCFFENEVGIDIEYNAKQRKFKKILSRFNLVDLPEDNMMLQKFFYDFWTKHEACYKLNSVNDKVFIRYSYEIPNYTICVASDCDFEINNLVEITE